VAAQPLCVSAPVPACAQHNVRSRLRSHTRTLSERSRRRTVALAAAALHAYSVQSSLARSQACATEMAWDDEALAHWESAHAPPPPPPPATQELEPMDASDGTGAAAPAPPTPTPAPVPAPAAGGNDRWALVRCMFVGCVLHGLCCKCTLRVACCSLHCRRTCLLLRCQLLR
jgi:hypothetical protein